MMAPVLKGERGVTLLEVAVGLAILGLILAPTAGIINQFIFLPAQISATNSVLTNSRAAVRVIAEDALQATSFTTSTAPDYGTFTWTDRAKFPVDTYSIRYSYDSSTTSLMREETINGTPLTRTITSDVATSTHVVLSESGGIVSATVTSTAEAILNEISRGVTVSVRMRVSPSADDDTPPPFRLAWDDVETGDLLGGGGWIEDWSISGNVDASSLFPPTAEGTYHLRLFDATSTASRPVDLSTQDEVSLSLWIKVVAFSGSEQARLVVQPDGGSPTTLRTWDVNTTNNTYFYVYEDLSSFSMTNDFQISFELDNADSGDGFFVDDLEVLRLWDTLEPVASDGLESGGLSGGQGWSSSWQTAGTVDATDLFTPVQEGTYHLRLAGDTATSTRAVDMSNMTNARLKFWAKVDSFEGGEVATLSLSVNGGSSYTAVRTWTSSEPDNTYVFVDEDLSGFTGTNQWVVKFDIQGDAADDRFFVDDLKLFGVTQP